VASFLREELARASAEAETSLRESEPEVRRALATVPLTALRDAGLLDAVLALAGDQVPSPTTDQDDVDDFDDMDVDDLLQRALGGAE
jgi:hypothetical protein